LDHSRYQKCKLKRELYQISRVSNDPTHINKYKLHCKQLSSLTAETKRTFYDKKISDSNNKMKTIWDIVNSESGRNNKGKEILKINIDGKVISNHKIISNSFNTYFLTIADTVREKTQNITNSVTKEDYPLKYLVDIYIRILFQILNIQIQQLMK
jgi:hypothetical protein